jgi:hypothetical protein
MKFKFLAGFFPVLVLALSAWWFSQPQAESSAATPPVAAVPPASPLLEEALVGRFAPYDIGQTFTLPAGPKGLEYSAAARALDGKLVRISGSMVRQANDDHALFLLTPQPMVLNMEEYGLADDLPPQAVHVVLPVLPGQAPDWVRQPLVVYGRLELGGRQEKDGRISQTRLFAEHITAADGRTPIEPRRSVILQPDRVKSGKLSTPPLSASVPESRPTSNPP